MSTYRVNRGKAFGISVLAIILVIAFVVTSWFAYWFIALRSADHRAHIRRASFEAQETARVQVSKSIVDLAALDAQLASSGISAQEKTALSAQKQAIVSQACLVGERIRGGDVPNNVQQFIEENC